MAPVHFLEKFVVLGHGGWLHDITVRDYCTQFSTFCNFYLLALTARQYRILIAHWTKSIQGFKFSFIEILSENAEQTLVIARNMDPVFLSFHSKFSIIVAIIFFISQKAIKIRKQAEKMVSMLHLNFRYTGLFFRGFCGRIFQTVRKSRSKNNYFWFLRGHTWLLLDNFNNLFNPLIQVLFPHFT